MSRLKSAKPIWPIKRPSVAPLDRPIAVAEQRPQARCRRAICASSPRAISGGRRDGASPRDRPSSPPGRRGRSARKGRRMRRAVSSAGAAPIAAYFLPRVRPPKRLLKRATWPPVSSILLVAAGPGRVRGRIDVELQRVAFLAPGGAGLEDGAVGHLHLDHVVIGVGIGHRLPFSPPFEGRHLHGGRLLRRSTACQSRPQRLERRSAFPRGWSEPAKITEDQRHEDRYPPRLPHDQGADDRRHRLRDPLHLGQGRRHAAARHRSDRPPGLDRRQRKLLDTGGQVARFNKRFGGLTLGARNKRRDGRGSGRWRPRA